MTWRLAKSLEQLRNEVHALSPQTVIGTIGDAAHQAEASDHNPNASGVVCAADIMEGFGLDLAAVAEQVRTSGHPDLKYVIYNRRIASRTRGLAWRAYTGSDPHTDHVHVSVGVGLDGQSRPPYDDTASWGIGDPLMALSDQDAQALIWRVEALVNGRDKVAGGPTKDEPVALVANLAGLRQQVAQLAPGSPGSPADLSPLVDRLAALEQAFQALRQAIIAGEQAQAAAVAKG